MGKASDIDGPASTAHCFYCFEVLSSNYDNTTPPTLATVVQLWEEYRANRGASGTLANKLTSPSRSSALSPSSDKTTATTSSSGSGSSHSALDTSADSSSTSLSSATQPPSSALLSSLSASYPVYVTWNTLSSRGKSLRGCIGTFEALPLEEGLKTYTLVSALEDYRFSPVPASLVPQLGCELTLLADFEECADVMDWTVGTHGLKISFSWTGRRFGATYLPHVCPEQGWTKEECLESLMAKAGFERSARGGSVKKWLGGSQGEESRAPPWEIVQDMYVVRYTGFHADASYAEWQDWKKWVDGRA